MFLERVPLSLTHLNMTFRQRLTVSHCRTSRVYLHGVHSHKDKALIDMLLKARRVSSAVEFITALSKTCVRSCWDGFRKQDFVEKLCEVMDIPE